MNEQRLYSEAQIPPYIMENQNGISWYKYLHIVGGAGNWKGKPQDQLYGGEYDFCVFYAAPSDMKNKGEECHRFFCIANKIPYGIGTTIKEAYDNLKSKQ